MKSQSSPALDTTDKLLRLTAEYLKEKGGKAIITGPVCIIQMPGSTNSNFYLAVKVLGHKPVKSPKGSSQPDNL